MTSPRRPRGAGALRAWPERLAALRDDPTPEHLDSLCNLLDALDAWVCDRPDDIQRREALRRCRAEARAANQAVSEALAVGRALRCPPPRPRTVRPVGDHQTAKALEVEA